MADRFTEAEEQARLTDVADVEASNGNVFADLGLPNPEERLPKAKLSILISRAIAARGLTEAQAAT